MTRIRLESVQTDRSRPGPATVLIERGIGLIHVRPYRSRRMYTLPLADVARYIVARVVRAELLEEAREKRRKRPRGAK